MGDHSQWHATCVSAGSKGVLLLGDSGSGKSDLALRLIDTGAVLVADDRVDIAHVNGQLMASAPEKLKGKIEVRGLGIMQVAFLPQVALALAVQLVGRESVERLPEPRFFDCLGVKLPLCSLHAFDNSTPAKIRLSLR